MTQTTTALLVLAAQKGDTSAFSALCERHYQGSYRFAFKLCQCEQDAADLTQEVWSKVAKDIRVLLEPSAFKAWLFRAVYRRFIDLTRRRQKELLMAEPPPQQCGDTAKVERHLDLLALIAQLPDVERHSVYLFYLEELPIADIATVLDTPIGTIKSRLHSARQKLSQWARDERGNEHESRAAN
ncbi:RNA polymerase sigma factor [Pseudoalteromonas sp. T1lg75]|uniref:RNA polymerase sigma factor n=1 Tax=Pseudoalteromonas sp. T1lg75 TaxID=2077102 RepID=UPI000CF684FB|nr:RNA polymerase sigma factor [Pseudoalteromonas sp. T1lg75]